jgi:hypothetical protein
MMDTGTGSIQTASTAEQEHATGESRATSGLSLPLADDLEMATVPVPTSSKKTRKKTLTVKSPTTASAATRNANEDTGTSTPLLAQLRIGDEPAHGLWA